MFYVERHSYLRDRNKLVAPQDYSANKPTHIETPVMNSQWNISQPIRRGKLKYTKWCPGELMDCYCW